MKNLVLKESSYWFILLLHGRIYEHQYKFIHVKTTIYSRLWDLHMQHEVINEISPVKLNKMSLRVTVVEMCAL